MSVYDRLTIFCHKDFRVDDFPLKIKDLALSDDASLSLEEDYMIFTLNWTRLETDEEYEYRINMYEERKRKRDEAKMKRDRQEFERMVKEYGWTA